MKASLSDHFSRKITWTPTDDDTFPFTAQVDEQDWKIRLNDFPKEPLYTLFIGRKSMFDFDDWPINWKR